MSAPLRAAVVLASAGRPQLLADIAAEIDTQTVAPAAKVFSVPDATSLPEGFDHWQVVSGVRGLAAQRNAGIAALGDDIDLVFFFDDDAVVRADYLEQGIAYFTAHPEVVGLTGRVLLDGAAHSQGEVSRADALAALARSESDPLTRAGDPSRTLYGCNFAYRRSAVPEIGFDERQPLYSWLEDHDFARRLMRHGALSHVEDCVIVHRGAGSGGRTNHRRLGYSQLMNPVYLNRTGSFPLWLTLVETVPRISKNVVLSVAGSEREWRRERVGGNAMALRDVLRGRITPERILELS